MASEVENPWICKASLVEKIYEEAHQRRTILIVYQLSLCTVQPLQEDHVRQSLIHLQRKCPIFRMCYGERNGVIGFCKSNQDIDFQVVTETKAYEVMDMLQSYRFNSEKGPLWCARLLRDKKTDVYTLDEGFPYTSQLLLAVHHGIADGTTMVKICGNFVKILENVISGEPVNDEEQIGHFVSDTKMEELISKKMKVIQNDPTLMQELSESENDYGIGIPMLLSVVPPPEGGKDNTHSVSYILDKNTTKRFIDRCKAEGVTVHSAFTALTNASLVQLLVGEQYIKESYRLRDGHLINLRRYWPGDTSQLLGCHAHFPLNLWTNVPRDVQSNFWDYARNVHRDLHYHLKAETPILRDAFSKLDFPKPNFDDIFHPSNELQVDNVFSNLGDITPVLTEGGFHVKPYLLKRRISIHKTCISNFDHFLVTFRGRMILDLLYNTKFFTPDITKKHCDQIFNILDEVIE